MNALTIKNSGDDLLIQFNRNSFDKTYLMSIIKRLELEAKAKEINISSKISTLANEIDKIWLAENGENFLKDVKKK